MSIESPRVGSQLDIQENSVSWDQKIIDNADALIEQRKNLALDDGRDEKLIKEYEKLSAKNKNLKNNEDFMRARAEMIKKFGKQIAENDNTEEIRLEFAQKMTEELVDFINAYEK